MKSFKKVVLKGTAYERGRAYGSDCGELIKLAVGNYKRFFDAKASKLSWSEAGEYAKRFLPAIEAYAPECIEEMRGISDGSGMSSEDILAINCRSELQRINPKTLDDECSTVSVTPRRSENGHLMMAQNWDMYHWAEQHGVVLEILQDDGPDCMVLTEAGQLARYGMNQNGIGLTLNSIPQRGADVWNGVPSTVVRRKFLTTNGCWADNINAILTSKLMVPLSFTIGCGDGAGDLMCLEAWHEGADIIYPENGVIIHTNHWVAPGSPPAAGRKGSSICRYNSLRRLMLETTGSISVNDIMAALNDPFGMPEAILSFRNPCEPESEQAATLACFIIDATARKLWIRRGNNRENAFVEYRWTRPDKIHSALPIL